MLYSIGYQRSDLDTFIQTLKEHSIEFLVDVRSKPYSRKHQFNQGNLKHLLEGAGITYIWAGRTLGGFTPIVEKDIEYLAHWQEDKVACLMCLEADPLQCHRNDIAERLRAYGVQVRHISEGGELL